MEEPHDFHGNKKPSINIPLILAGIFVIVIIVGGIFIWSSLNPSQEQKDLSENSNEPLENSALIECKDWDCFIEASKTCSLASFTHSLPISGDDPVEGIFSLTRRKFVEFNLNRSFSSTNYYELKGLKEDRCLFYLRSEKNNLEFKEEYIQLLLDSGLTQEKIDLKEKISKMLNDDFDGKEGTSSFDPLDLTNFLNNWRDGIFLGSALCGFDVYNDLYLFAAFLDASIESGCILTGDWKSAKDFEGTYFYSPFSPSENVECRLKVQSAIGFSLEDYTPTRLSISDFSDSSNLQWLIEDESIVTLEDGYADYIKTFVLKKTGITNIIVKDTGINNCESSIYIEVID